MVPSLVLSLCLGYLLAFNVIPEGYRPALAALVATCACLSIFLIAITSGHLRVNLIVPLVAIMVGVACTAIVNPAASEVDALRWLAPFLLAVASVGLPSERLLRPLGVAAIAVTIFALATWAVAGFVSIGNLIRPVPFTGGEEGAHSSAYLVAIAYMSLDVCRRNGSFRNSVSVCFQLATIALLAAYQVATAILMVATYIALSAYRAFDRRLSFPRLVFLALATLSIVVAHELLTAGSITEVTGAAGSGRLAAWQLRIEVLSNRELPQLLFGTGAGSDSFYTSLWWWEQKDAHSDLLTLVVEFGLFTWLCTAALVASIYRKLKGPAAAILVAAIVGSTVSNALLSRPIHALVFWLLVSAAAAAYARSTSVGEKITSNPPGGELWEQPPSYPEGDYRPQPRLDPQHTGRRRLRGQEPLRPDKASHD